MRKDYGKNNRCPYCGKYFNYLGIARHRTACWEKLTKKVMEAKSDHADRIEMLAQELEKVEDK